MQWLGLEGGKLDPLARFQPFHPTARQAAVTQVNTEGLGFCPEAKGAPCRNVGEVGQQRGAAVPGLGWGCPRPDCYRCPTLRGDWPVLRLGLLGPLINTNPIFISSGPANAAP